jgi:hypothetical protein
MKVKLADPGGPPFVRPWRLVFHVKSAAAKRLPTKAGEAASRRTGGRSLRSVSGGGASSASR